MDFYIRIWSIVSYWYVFCSIVNHGTINRAQLSCKSKITNFNDSGLQKRLIEMANNNEQI